MSSGFGIGGRQGRCFGIWQDFSACLAESDEPKQCKAYRDDYLECLHHREEFKALNTLFRGDKAGKGAGEGEGGQAAGGGH